jgi:hypothetical protein
VKYRVAQHEHTLRSDVVISFTIIYEIRYGNRYLHQSNVDLESIVSIFLLCCDHLVDIRDATSWFGVVPACLAT